MSWRTVSVVLIVVASVAILQSLLADPLIQVLNALASSGDYSNVAGTGMNGNTYITGLAGSWLNMGLVLIFGIMAWGLARVLRRELTRGRL